MSESIKKFINHYNRYVKQYKNKAKENVVSAYAELITVQQGIQQRIDDQYASIDQEIEMLEHDLNFKSRFDFTWKENTEFESVEAGPKDVRKRLQKKEEIMQLVKGFTRNQYFSTLESNLEKASDKIREFYELRDYEYDVPTTSLNHIETINRIHKKVELTETNLRAIKAITNKIVDEDFPTPDNIKYFKYLTGEEKQNLTNEVAHKMVKRSEEITNNYNETILKEAKCLIDENKDKCITASGNASSYLYKTIHRKLDSVKKERRTVDPPSPETVKNRINNFIKEGILKVSND